MFVATAMREKESTDPSEFANKGTSLNSPSIDATRVERTPRHESVQPTLTISQPGDLHEREAERVAEAVMRTSKPASGLPRVSAISSTSSAPPLQRFCAECEDEITKLPTISSLSAIGATVQAKEGGTTAHAGPAMTSNLLALRGGGNPLPAVSREFFESRFGVDFSRVRIHSDAQAARAAAEIRAHAFSVGAEIFFAEGRYQPHTREGQRLLAHELTHTLQQGGGGAHPSAETVYRYSWDEFVDDAETVGSTIAGGASGAVDTVSSAAATVGQSVTSSVEAAGEAVSTAASSTVSWLENEAGQLALHGARELAARIGGSVGVVGTTIVITIPDVELCTPRSIPLTVPIMNLLVPLWGWAGVFGPVGVGAAAGVRLGLQPSLAFSYGPCRLRKVSLQLDPIAGKYAGTGQLYVAGAVTDTIVGEGALKAIGIVGLIEPPIALKAGVEGGLRVTLRGVGAGALEETVQVAYSGGGFSLDLDSTLRLGGAIELACDFFANGSLNDLVLCEYVMPLVETTLISDADRWEFPIRVTKDGLSAGPLTSKPIPFSDIEVFINRQRPEKRCLSLDQIKEELCRRGYLPPVECTKDFGRTESPPVGISVGPGQKPKADVKPKPGSDACQDLLNLRPGYDFWIRPRAPIGGNTTVAAAAFRLEHDINPPSGQDTTPASRLWVRTIGQPTDDAGHVIANRFGGRADFNSPNGNIFPQDLSFNRGTMRSYDAVTAGLHKRGCDVCVHIGLSYASSSDFRPNEAQYTILYRSPGASLFNPPIGPALVPNP
ncbi:eCIS core domain-containing protein [Paraburkholderia terrae]|uniref:eCIS core domain-containing protein n=1 Tax=Paraburkholderia terrae TaxID=311230 RepID=UPI00296AF2EC|nr:DUF4157 domain-containing protein [Paraburkholderia terrae]MDW3660611.1 DUF4157 domain-containing protein [Paraburkholderia terrae]